MTNHQFLEWKDRSAREFATWVMASYPDWILWSNSNAIKFSRGAIGEVLRILRNESTQHQVEIVQHDINGQH